MPKLTGGPDLWAKIGAATGALGVSFAPTPLGLMAALAEALGGLLLALGLAFRPACFFLAGTMLVASAHHLNKGDGFNGASHAIEDGIVFASLILIGRSPCRPRAFRARP